jgi:hypothetical protein
METPKLYRRKGQVHFVEPLEYRFFVHVHIKKHGRSTVRANVKNSSMLIIGGNGDISVAVRPFKGKDQNP